ncbi:uncharacterized protein PHACADRAFT_259052, partial [Phanerochaete carnosa HHB-10118-sp]
MRGYSEDIDALLVLVSLRMHSHWRGVLTRFQDGLFSAVVAGFLVVAITMLQEDTGQTSVELLSTISNQLSSLTVVPPYINSTSNGPPIQPFQPESAARWINSLWFISLILSLASAVVGILAKQWIREYLQWDSPTSASRENVLVREIRMEAWEEWHTMTIVSAVPALLEIAIILFTCGMAVFVWTLDDVVAVVVTICIGLFLLLIAALTLLPAVYKHCPYKSPTAWAVTCFLRWLVICCRYAIKTLPRYLHLTLPSTSAAQGPTISQFNDHCEKSHSLAYLRPEATPTWRLRDLRGAQPSKLRNGHGQMAKSHSVLLEDLKLELQDPIQWHLGDLSAPGALAPAVLHTHATAISEADLLFKALVHFVIELPNSDSLRYIAQCAQLMHPPLNCLAAPDYVVDLSADVHLAEIALDGAFR